MFYTPIKTKNFFLNALLLSVIIHFSLLQGIFLSFPNIQVTTNPAFVFLGGILDTYDLAHPTSKRTALSEQLPLHLQARNKEVSLTPSATTSVPKPLAPEGKSTREYLKSTFLEKAHPAKKQGTSQEIEELKKKFYIPPRVPLQLYNND